MTIVCDVCGAWLHPGQTGTCSPRHAREVANRPDARPRRKKAPKGGYR